MNTFIANGRVATTPKLTKTKNDHSKCTFNFASNTRYKNMETDEYYAHFTHVELYGKLADTVFSSVAVGTPLFIQGELVTRSYVEKETNETKHYDFCAVSRFEFLENKEQATKRKENHKEQPISETEISEGLGGFEPPMEIEDDDIPF